MAKKKRASGATLAARGIAGAIALFMVLALIATFVIR
jgi:hypothetical protein